MMAVVAGCAADADPPPVVTIETPSDVVVIAPDDAATQEADVCALAAELPLGDVCSLICDPIAMAEHMIATGSTSGQCYQLYCQLSEDAHVLVGVCLPP